MLILRCDNLGGIDLIKDTKHYNKAKHIKIRYLYIRNDIMQRNKLQIEHIPSVRNNGMVARELPLGPAR